MTKLYIRLKAAWYAFWMNEFIIVIDGYHKVAVLGFNSTCDTKDCEHEAEICMSRTIAKFKIENEEHRHVCQECANKIEDNMVEVKL